MKNETTTTKALFQINSKGERKLKIYGVGTEKELTYYLLKICKRAADMETKNGAKYLRTLGVSKNQPVYFNSFNSSILGSIKSIKVGEFVNNYSADTLGAILDELTAQSI